MKKLRLSLDDLKVGSFHTGAVNEEPGTVLAARATYGQYTCGIWCPPTTDPRVTGPCAC